MQTKHKVVVAVTILICLVMFFFPPLTAHTNGTTMNLGYSFIFKPQVNVNQKFVMVNSGLLFAQWIATWFISALILLFVDDEIRKFVTRKFVTPDRLGTAFAVIVITGMIAVLSVFGWLN